MHRVLQEMPTAAITALVVWLQMQEGDDEAAARRAVTLCPDSRASHFYDPGRLSGRAVAAALKARPGSIAWDAYLVYGPGARWDAAPPAPAPLEWVHQLQGSRWADPARYRTGDSLLAALRAAVAAAT